ncbi:flagellar motor switch phosphatase FliY [Fervidibacillus halotolerans]|uniref:Flagellar motor switch phosphatase FliY n=1 Tax=Fervidibacillus halotolerans TaxID=2980027 RepID=A0A9E8M1M4_9BACI|nr:flagellar motor switch phosphatase FliY [Fervidibacillus halotolerans]WAA13594.1 flagellar motor switch phosphatase FliY [Fervidibacillus halotolerans]
MKSDGLLSQEEIDALLNGDTTESNEKMSHSSDKLLTEVEQDALGEIGNISFGNSATALSTLLNQKVEITTPSVSIIRKENLEREFPHPYVAVVVNYTAGFGGSNLLVINQRDASIIADLMLGGSGEDVSEEINELQMSAIQEAMNQMMGSAATSMSTIFDKRVEISPPIIDILNIPEKEGIDKIPEDDPIVKIGFKLTVGNLINSTIMQLLPIRFAKSMVTHLINKPEPKEEHRDRQFESMDHDGLEIEEQYLEESNQSMKTSSSLTKKEKPKEKKKIQPAVFQDFQEVIKEEGSEPRNLQMLFDIPLQVTVELGRTKKVVKDILDLSPGSIIELDKLAGEPVDILVNNRLIAKGEVVVIEENFGVRVTEILSKSERMKRMK